MTKTVTSRFVLKGDNQLNSAFSKAGKQLGQLAKQATLFGAAFGAVALRQIIKNTEAQEAAVAQLNASLQSTGRFTDENARALRDHAAALQSVTTFGDEAIISAQSQLLTFTQLGTEVFPRATAAVLDLSTKMGTDLRSSVVQIGKALNDPILGVTALARSGIQFTVQQKDMIRTLVESGDVLSAQKIILKELETQFGGSAKAARETLGGALKGAQNAFGDLLEGDSGSDGMRGAVKALNDLTATLNDPDTKEGFARLTESVVSFLGKLAQVPGTVGFIKDEIKELFGIIANNDFDRREDEIGDLEDQLESARRQSVGFFGGENELFAARAKSLENEIRLKKESLEFDRLASQTRKRSLNIPALLDLPAPPAASVISPAEEKRIDKIRSSLDSMFQQVREFGKTGEQKALIQLIDLGATEDEIARAMLILDEVRILGEEEKNRQEAIKTRNELESEYQSLVQSTRTEIEQHNALIARIGELYTSGVIPSAAEYADVVKRTGEAFVKSQEKLDTLTEFGIQAARKMQDSFADFLFAPFDKGLDGMLKGFANTIRQMAAQAASSAILSAFFGGLAGSSNSFAAGIGTAFGGKRAEGGPIDPGKAFLVGERGPELIVPRRSGTVIPNAGSSIVININAPGADAGTFARLREIARTEIVPQAIQGATQNTLSTLRRPRFA